MDSAATRPWRLAGPASGRIDLLAGEHVAHLDDVADGPDVRIGRAHLRVDDDAAARAERRGPASLASAGLGPHADGQDDEIGGEARAALGDHDEPLAVRPRCAPARRRDAAARRCAARCSVTGAAISGSSGGITCGSFSSTRHREPAMDQVLDHLQADEAAADDDRRAGAALGDPRADAARVGDVAHGEDAGQVDARQRRAGSAPRPATAPARRSAPSRSRAAAQIAHA